MIGGTDDWRFFNPIFLSGVATISPATQILIEITKNRLRFK